MGDSGVLTTNKPSVLESRGLFKIWIMLSFVVVVACVWYAPNRDHFWLVWEVGTLATTTLYTLLFYVRLFFRKDENQQYLHEGFSKGLIGVLPPLCLVAVVLLGLATAFAGELVAPPLGMKNYYASLWCIFVATICFCAIDLLLATMHSHAEVKREFRQGLLLNAVPMCVAFLILLLFVSRFDGELKWDVPLKTFLGGAIALEMLVSNTVFAILFWKPKEL